LITKRKKIYLKIAFLTNLKTQEPSKQVLVEDHQAEDHQAFQVDHQVFHLHQGFLILLTDILLLHIPIYQFIMEPTEDIC